jgi:hypothetical protein
MHRRQIVLADGRYLIFYTFEDEENTVPDLTEAGKSEREQEENPRV